jgi:transcription elongation factor Elf1
MPALTYNRSGGSEHKWRQFLHALERDFTCPRCSGGVPNNDKRGEYVGALSRTDNKTTVCSDCGTEEALEQHFGDGLKPQSEWWATTEFNKGENQ